MEEVSTHDGTKCWTMSSVKYLKAENFNVAAKFGPDEQLLTRCDTRFISRYPLAEDTTHELDVNGLQYFQEMIMIMLISY